MGFFILLSAFIYIIISLILVRTAFNVSDRKKNKIINGWVVLLIMFLIPTWDIIPSKIYFEYTCRKEAGLFVHKKIALPEEYWVKPGVQYFTGNIKRPNYAKRIRINEQKINDKYKIETITGSYAWLGNMDIYESRLIDLNSGEILSRAVTLYSKFSWLSYLIPTTSRGYPCPYNGKSLVRDSYISNHDLFQHTFTKQN